MGTGRIAVLVRAGSGHGLLNGTAALLGVWMLHPGSSQMEAHGITSKVK